jgi:glycolate dehydrogenase iron-sulfur subunit
MTERGGRSESAGRTGNPRGEYSGPPAHVDPSVAGSVAAPVRLEPVPANEAIRKSTVLEPYHGEEARLLACVHCGFCLDACPTYIRLGMEADSPRGRLYLMRAVAEGRVDAASIAFETHLDRCLGCRACEPVCPSGVQYGYLLERGRAIIAATHKASRLERMLLTTFGNLALSRAVMAGGRMLRDTGLAAWMARRFRSALPRASFAMAMLAASRAWTGLRAAGNTAARDRPDNPRSRERQANHGDPEVEALARAPGVGLPTAGPEDERPARPDASARSPVSSPRPARSPDTSARSADSSPPPAGSKARIALLRGCVQDGLFGRVNIATREVLRVNDCTLVDVPDQVCCGALHAHGGALDGARDLALRNIEAFEEAGADRVVVNAAGCGAAMKEYGELFNGRPEHGRAAAFAAKVVDVSEFLAGIGPRHGAPIPLRAAWDAPCHLLHAQRIDRAPLDVLAAIPGLDVIPIQRADECCGGAGTYGMTHPDLGGRILDDKIRNVRSVGADIVVTPNPGCMMQIGAGLLLAGDSTPVLHPVELLAESYRRSRRETDGLSAHTHRGRPA